MLTLGLIFEEPIDLSDCPVIRENLKAMVCCIHDQILAHDGQANKAEICSVVTLANRTGLEPVW